MANTDADHAASHLGRAVGIATLLRGTAFHAQQRRCYLPLEVLAEYKCVGKRCIRRLFGLFIECMSCRIVTTFEPL